MPPDTMRRPVDNLQAEGDIMAKVENCFNCVYSHWDRCLAARALCVGVPTRPSCANHPESFGRMQACPVGQVCRNFRARPPTPKGEAVKRIPLGDGHYAYVDAADFEWLSRWTWSLRGGYAIRQQNGRTISMHRQIMRTPKGLVVDHKNGNKLDNTRENLRNCTRAENARNRPKQHGSTSRFKGVSYSPRHQKYFATVYGDDEPPFLGLFVEEEDAARAYDYRAVEAYGEFARLNFPEEWPPDRRAEVHAKGKVRPKRKKKARGPKAKKKTRATSARKTPRGEKKDKRKK